MIVVHKNCRDHLLAMTEENKGQEVCALLLVEKNQPLVISMVRTIANVASKPSVQFLLHAQTHLKIQREARESGQAIKGLFHNHPNGPAELSKEDCANAAVYPDWIWLLGTMINGKPVLKAYDSFQNGLNSLAIKTIDA